MTEYRVVPKSAGLATRRWKYEGGDMSLLYRYFSSPFADFLVHTCVPEWMAPNLVTLIGFAFVVFAHVLTMVYNFDLSGEVPGWVSVTCGVCIFAYQTLDNMDGKQARRVKAGSALGFLFDHGCDAMNAGLLSPITLAAAMGAGGENRVQYALGLWLITVIPFFMNTWEEFHIGKFVLPIVNGPNEGLLVVIGVFFATGMFGKDIWWDWSCWPDSGRLWFAGMLGMSQPADLIMLLGAVSVPITVFVQLANATSHVRKHGTPPGADDAGQSTSVAAVLRALPLVGVVGGILATVVYAPELFFAAPRFVFWLYGLIFTEICSHLMIAHVCRTPFQPSRLAMASSLALPLVALLLQIAKYDLQDPIPQIILRLTLAVATAIAAFHTVRFIHTAVHNLAEILNINIFVLGPRQKVVKPVETKHKDSPRTRSVTPKRSK